MARSHLLRTTSSSGLRLAVLLCSVYGSFGQYYGQYPSSDITFGQAGIGEPLGSPETRGRSSRCYNEAGQAQKCVPEFVNAAFGRPVDVTNTCGEERPQEYCLQTGGYGSKKACEFCNAHRPELSHPPHYLTDFNNHDNHTWWQSETMYEGIQFPNQVNITLNLGKSFDITYVRLFFHSPRPESFAILKRSTYDEDWTPYQYYSATCRDTYGIQDSTYVRREYETRALCTSEFSDISPLTGGNVAFSTLENRPSAYNFENSPDLQDWVTATELRIVLDRLNTFRDEVFGDKHVLQSYFYAITDLAVGGRCKCNGHASECVESTGVGGQSQLVCRCEHNTAGRDCEECLPFYNDAPWSRATSSEANECRSCNCNGYSNRCYFDQDLYDRTGHGGYCLDCADNRAGPNCERCSDNYFERQDGACIACNCNEIGSRSLQCARDGVCQCKSGVTGAKCDRCAENFFDFSPQGCKPCGCNTAGSLENRASCDSTTGVCVCKENVEGQQCHQCKPGYFNLNDENEFGCTPCFCYGHSSICSSADGYSQGVIESGFVRGEERWKGVESTGRSVSLNYNAVVQSLAVAAPGRDKVYFLAPGRFLGDQRASYNHKLSFYLRIGELGPQATTEDIILEGAGLSISAPIFAQGNSLPSTQKQKYTFNLHENAHFGWSPRLNSRDFISLLSNLTAIKIRGTYTYEGRGFLDDVSLETARRGLYGVPATWIEMCTCPEGYVGQYCESCAPGYRHSPSNGGPFASCIPCDCNNHADICDSETGRCICQHNTAGEQCELCGRGYYGNALRGTPTDCQPCPCPNRGTCIQLSDDTIVCLDCPTGYAGTRCELCTDGYFGDPQGRHGTPRICEECDCNGNIDPNAVGNCNRTSGECLKCIHNTGGFYCDQCLPGYYGDPLASPKGDCQPCYCNAYGTEAERYGPPICDQVTGQCQCKAHVSGLKCNECEEGFWNLTSGRGCESCNCDPIGSLNNTCNVITGQCFCREGVTGQKCDLCEPYHYGFSSQGCRPCDCDNVGSVYLQCDASGQCPCRENVDGRRCDKCEINTYDKQAGCRECPACYTLVLDSVSVHRERLAELERMLEDILSHPTVLNDRVFEETLAIVMSHVEDLWNDAQDAAKSGGDKTVTQHIEELQDRIREVRELLQKVRDAIRAASSMAEQGESNITQAEAIIKGAQKELRKAQHFLDVEGYEALAEAIRRSKVYGQQSARMTEIADEAGTLATTHENEAKNIEQVAYDARNISSEAVTLVRKAVGDQRNISEVIKDLKKNVQNIAILHEDTLKMANKSHALGNATYLETLSIYNDATSIVIPQLDADLLTNEANALHEEAKHIKAEAEELIEQKRELVEDLQIQLVETTLLLNRSRILEQETSELLADTYTAEGQAKDAIQTAEKILTEAQETLRILDGFDKQVQDSREEALDALKLVEKIEQNIWEAEETTSEAEVALTGAEDNAKNARDIAKTAQKTAMDASEQAEVVRHKADITKVEASTLKDRADDLANRVAGTESRVATYENQLEKDKARVLEAQEKANQAKGRADEASARVHEALETVQEILDLLDRSTDIDSSQLDALSERLNQGWQTFSQSGIETAASEFSRALNWQQRQISLYESEIRKLQIEVRNIEEIKISLPAGCFRFNDIETKEDAYSVII